MTGISSNADQVAASLQARAASFGEDVARGIRAITFAVENAAIANLTGSGAPYTYPVPIRTGHLRRSIGRTSERTEGFVFNTASYASAVHTGEVNEWGQGTVQRAARPFLDDAVAAVDVLGLMAEEIKKGALQ